MIGTIIGALIVIGFPLLLVIGALVISSKYDEEDRK